MVNFSGNCIGKRENEAKKANSHSLLNGNSPFPQRPPRVVVEFFCAGKRE
jgi:hypothetical protein